MKKLLCYQELLIHREHYSRLLSSKQVKPKARLLIRHHIGKLTGMIARKLVRMRVS
uniref:Ubiquinone biosynthesis protein COQ7 n=1 Tax=Gloeothece verrucosa (strain PCC 7822) TaxID=497965 RepID=E0U8B7_GLOV7|nr:ubiquinone biosynthesis protein COQ7 [Gloeothece verrucosa PCC 7822]